MQEKGEPEEECFAINSRWGMVWFMIWLPVLEKLDLLAVANQGRRHQSKRQGLHSGRGRLHTWIPRRNYAFERMVACRGPRAGAMEKKEQETKSGRKRKAPRTDPHD